MIEWNIVGPKVYAAIILFVRKQREGQMGGLNNEMILTCRLVMVIHSYCARVCIRGVLTLWLIVGMVGCAFASLGSPCVAQRV